MKCFAILALQALAFWPAALWYTRRMRFADSGAWELVPLALATIFILGSARSMRPPGGRARLVLLIVLAAYIAVRPFTSPLAAGVLACLIFGGTIVSMLPRRGGGLGLLGLLLLALPVLSILQFHCGYPLRVIVASIAAPLLSTTGLDVVREGTCLAWGDQLVWVDAPCSGIRMLWSSLLLVCALACFLRLDAWRSCLALGTTLVGVVIANVLRSAILFFGEAGLVKLPGWYHQGLGLAIHGLALVLLFVLVNRLRESQCATGSPT